MNTTLDKMLTEFALGCKIPMHLFEDSQLIKSYYKQEQDFNIPLYIVSSISTDLPEAFILCTPEYMHFAGLKLKDSSKIIIIGPVFATENTLSQTKKILARLNQTKADFNSFHKNLNALPRYTPVQLEHLCSFLYSLINGKTPEQVSSIEFEWKNLLNKSDMQLRTYDISENQIDFYNSETYLLSCIKYGKVEELTDFLNKAYISTPTPSDIVISDIKNFLIGTNTLLSRIAISSGMDYALANSTADYYMGVLSKSSNITDIKYVFFDVCTRYAKEIQKVKSFNNDSVIANNVYNFIRSHIGEKLNTKYIAEYLGYNESYLSKAFHDATDSTITAFIRKCKIEEAKFLLSTRSIDVQDVADMLCFSSPSRFCEIFKKETGQSPMEWLKSSHLYN